MPDSKIKEAILEKRFINAAIDLSKIHLDEDMRQEDKDFQMNEIWRGFKRFIYENYQEK